MASVSPVVEVLQTVALAPQMVSVRQVAAAAAPARLMDLAGRSVTSGRRPVYCLPERR
jgi:hypothetical protein